MKILFVTTGRYPHVGGKSSHIETIIRGLVELGNDCEIVSYSDIPVKKLWESLIKKILHIPYRFTNFDNYVWASEHIMQNTFEKIVKKHCGGKYYDIVVAEDPSAALISNHIFGSQIPIVLVMHSYFGKSMGIIKKNRFSASEQYFENQKNEHLSAIDKVNMIIAVDDRIRKDCENYVHLKRSNIPVKAIENFVDTEKYKPNLDVRTSLIEKYETQNKIVISCIRRLCDKNGVRYAVEAMKYLSDDYILLVGGDGDCKDELEGIITREELENRVRLLGSLDSEKVIELYNISDYVLVPSVTVNGLQEATSISALEAMSFGIPVIASAIGGLKQMITDSENGILVQERSSHEIAEAIIRLQQDKYLKDKISKNARNEVINKYSYLVGAKRYYSEFGYLVEH